MSGDRKASTRSKIDGGRNLERMTVRDQLRVNVRVENALDKVEMLFAISQTATCIKDLAAVTG